MFSADEWLKGRPAGRTLSIRCEEVEIFLIWRFSISLGMDALNENRCALASRSFRPIAIDHPFFLSVLNRATLLTNSFIARFHLDRPSGFCLPVFRTSICLNCISAGVLDYQSSHLRMGEWLLTQVREWLSLFCLSLGFTVSQIVCLFVFDCLSLFV